MRPSKTPSGGAWVRSTLPSRPVLPARTISRAAAPLWKSANPCSRDAEAPARVHLRAKPGARACSGVADQDTRGEDDEASDHDLEGGAQEFRFHVVRPHP